MNTGVRGVRDEFTTRHVVIVRRSYTYLTWTCVRGVPLGLHRLPPPVLVFLVKRTMTGVFGGVKPGKPVLKELRLLSNNRGYADQLLAERTCYLKRRVPRLKLGSVAY